MNPSQVPATNRPTDWGFVLSCGALGYDASRHRLPPKGEVMSREIATVAMCASCGQPIDEQRAEWHKRQTKERCFTHRSIHCLKKQYASSEDWIFVS
jgi:hypothetical protein